MYSKKKKRLSIDILKVKMPWAIHKLSNEICNLIEGEFWLYDNLCR